MNVKAKVVKVVEEKLCGGENFQLGESDSFLRNGLADSLAMMSLLEALETQFQIAAEPGEFHPDNLDSVNNITRYLASKGVSD